MKKYIKPITELTLVSINTRILAGSFDPANGMGGGDNGAITNENQGEFTILGKGTDLWGSDDSEDIGGSSSAYSSWDD